MPFALQCAMTSSRAAVQDSSARSRTLPRAAVCRDTVPLGTGSRVTPNIVITSSSCQRLMPSYAPAAAYALTSPAESGRRSTLELAPHEHLVLIEVARPFEFKVVVRVAEASQHM